MGPATGCGDEAIAPRPAGGDGPVRERRPRAEAKARGS